MLLVAPIQCRLGSRWRLDSLKSKAFLEVYLFRSEIYKVRAANVHWFN